MCGVWAAVYATLTLRPRAVSRRCVCYLLFTFDVRIADRSVCGTARAPDHSHSHTSMPRAVATSPHVILVIRRFSVRRCVVARLYLQLLLRFDPVTSLSLSRSACTARARATGPARERRRGTSYDQTRAQAPRSREPSPPPSQSAVRYVEYMTRRKCKPSSSLSLLNACAHTDIASRRNSRACSTSSSFPSIVAIDTIRASIMIACPSINFVHRWPYLTQSWTKPVHPAWPCDSTTYRTV